MDDPTHIREGLLFVQTCGACPEQYDVYFPDTDGVTSGWEEEPSGYIRLRHGSLRADYLGRTVITGQPGGDGAFTDDQERELWLEMSALAILGAGKPQ